jgi:hypothetical protein
VTSKTPRRPLTFGPRQFPARIGLPTPVFNQAVHTGLIPPPNPITRRWPAAVVEDVLTRKDEIRAAAEAGPDVGAARAAAVLSIRFDMHVDPRVLLELARMGLITPVGEYKGSPVYDALALKTFDDRAALEKAVRDGRLLMRDEAAEYLRVRRPDVDHLLRAGLLTPATWVRASWKSRQSFPDVALIRVGDLDALLGNPAIDWRAIRATRKGRRSPLADLPNVSGPA